MYECVYGTNKGYRVKRVQKGEGNFRMGTNFWIEYTVEVVFEGRD